MTDDRPQHDTGGLQIIGRSSSHFTRVALVFAYELGVPFELVPVHDMTRVDAEVYAGNPALKLPTLRRGDSLVFGAENICRTLAEIAGERRVVWPEELRSDLGRNAHELVRHAMAAQVQLIFGPVLCKLPADNLYFVKGKQGYEGALRWLDDNLARVLAELPAPRDLSFFEVALFCLVDHVPFRPTVALEPYPALVRFAEAFAQRPSAQRTRYRFDAPPA